MTEQSCSGQLHFISSEADLDVCSLYIVLNFWNINWYKSDLPRPAALPFKTLPQCTHWRDEGVRLKHYKYEVNWIQIEGSLKLLHSLENKYIEHMVKIDQKRILYASDYIPICD